MHKLLKGLSEDEKRDLIYHIKKKMFSINCTVEHDHNLLIRNRCVRETKYINSLTINNVCEVLEDSFAYKIICDKFSDKKQMIKTDFITLESGRNSFTFQCNQGENEYVENKYLYKSKSNKNFITFNNMFKESLIFPKVNTIYKYILSFKGEKHIIFPLFDFDSNIYVKSKYHCVKEHYFENYKYYNKLLKQINEIAQKELIYIYLPNLLSYEDYLHWKILIKRFIDNCKVGPVISDFEDIYDIEEYKNLDIAIIDYDELIYEVHGKYKISYNDFKDKSISEFRDLHTVLKQLKVEHIVYSSKLSDEKIIDKLMIMGFNNFIYSEENMENIEKTVKSSIKRREKYREKIKNKQSGKNSCN